CLGDLDRSLYGVGFLPDSPHGWRSLLCLPLHGDSGVVSGLLLTASERPRALEGFTHSLGRLGDFALSQLQLLQRVQASEDGPELAETAPAAIASHGLIGDSPAMAAVHRLVGKVLHSPVSVLVTGETGTGKELVARAIHD